MDAALSSWWRRLRAQRPSADERWVVVDTETTGLDPARAALLAIGGVGVGPHGILVGDSFEVVIRHEGSVDRSNVVIHGLGQEARLTGMPLEPALAAFVAWVGEAPFVACHAAFDRDVLEGAARQAGLRLPSRAWLDVAPVAAALAPASVAAGEAGLDHWLQAFDIACGARHNAAADALATAELLVKLRRTALRHGRAGFADLAALGRNRRWLARS